LTSEKYDGVEQLVRDFMKRPPITEEAKSQLLDACISGEVEKVEHIVKRYYLEV
jgi:hypothetical protein